MKKGRWVVVPLLFMLCGCLPEMKMPPLVNPQALEFTETYAVPGKSADEIYVGVKSWIVANFLTDLPALEYDFKNQGTLIGNGELQVSLKSPTLYYGAPQETELTFIPFKMRVDIKSEKFVLKYYDIHIRYPGYDYEGVNSQGVEYQYQLDAIKPQLQEIGPKLVQQLQQGT